MGVGWYTVRDMRNTGDATETGRRAAELTRTAERYASLGHMDAAARALRSADEIRGAGQQPVEDEFAATRHADRDSYHAALAAYYDAKDKS